MTSLVWLCSYTIRDSDLKIEGNASDYKYFTQLAGAIQQLRDRVADLEKSCHN